MTLNSVAVVMLALSCGCMMVGCGSDTTGPSGASTAAGPWARSAGGPGNDSVIGVAVDGSGNIVVAGTFPGDATFGGTTLTSAGAYDIFLAKYDVSGKLLWADSGGGAGNEGGGAVAIDGSGNLVVAGYYEGSATFGGTTLTSAGGIDAFVAKYDAGGTLQWVRSSAGVNNTAARGVAVDASGNVVVEGAFSGITTFGGTTLTSAGSYDVFVAKYDAAGTLLWAHSAGGTGEEIGEAVAVDGSGNAVVSGSFSGTAIFGGTTLTSAGDTDMFVAKYDAAGTFLWARSAGGLNGETGHGIGVDKSGNVVVTGYFIGDAVFGATTLTSMGADDVFVAKYDPAGTLVWVRSAGGPGDDLSYSVVVDRAGSASVTGAFLSSATFGTTTLTSTGSADVFVARYDASGHVEWAHAAGGAGGDAGIAIAVDGSRNAVVTGSFTLDATFGGKTLTSAGSYDVFVARMSSNGF